MASLVLSGDTSGSVTLAAPAVAGSTTQTLVNVTGTLAPLVAGTAQASTSGTSIDFTGIPSWAKRITVMFNGVSTSGTSSVIVQLGDSGGIETTGYVGSGANGANASVAFTTGFPATILVLAANTSNGLVTIATLGANAWAATSLMGVSAGGNQQYGGGSKTLSDTLTQVRITTVNGTDTFDAGTINILYE
jgi:hypothetical protein